MDTKINVIALGRTSSKLHYRAWINQNEGLIRLINKDKEKGQGLNGERGWK